ncbi:hypothetical protein Lal_00044884 [Lupinus albus]|nr:hypothetical protein Lal_00044884 [Lupinus albus]
MAKFTLGIMADGDDEPVRRIAISAGDESSAQFAANAAYEKVRREYPDATELHLMDAPKIPLAQAWPFWRNEVGNGAGEGAAAEDGSSGRAKEGGDRTDRPHGHPHGGRAGGDHDPGGPQGAPRRAGQGAGQDGIDDPGPHGPVRRRTQRQLARRYRPHHSGLAGARLPAVGAGDAAQHLLDPARPDLRQGERGRQGVAGGGRGCRAGHLRAARLPAPPLDPPGRGGGAGLPRGRAGAEFDPHPLRRRPARGGGGHGAVRPVRPVAALHRRGDQRVPCGDPARRPGHPRRGGAPARRGHQTRGVRPPPRDVAGGFAFPARIGGLRRYMSFPVIASEERSRWTPPSPRSKTCAGSPSGGCPGCSTIMPIPARGPRAPTGRTRPTSPRSSSASGWRWT